MTATRSARAFTLVELLVSTAVLSLLLLMLAQISSMLGNTWSSGNGRAERRQSGRALVDFIAQELRAAALPIDRTPGIMNPDLQFVVNPSSVPAGFRQPSAIFWQAPIASDTERGDMAVLGYFVKWTAASGSKPPRADLCRIAISPGAANHKIYDELTTWVTGAILQAEAPADETSGYKGLFAENVIGFWVRCLDQQGKVIEQAGVSTGGFDSRTEYIGQIRDVNGAWIPSNFTAPVLPDSVDISLVLLDSRAADQMTADLASAMQSAAQNTSNAAQPASEFIQIMQSNPAMKRLLPGLSAHSLRVYLENAP